MWPVATTTVVTRSFSGCRQNIPMHFKTCLLFTPHTRLLQNCTIGSNLIYGLSDCYGNTKVMKSAVVDLYWSMWNKLLTKRQLAKTTTMFSTIHSSSAWSATCVYADKVALLEFARRTPLLQQSINISCPPGPQQQTCSSGFAAVGPYWDRQTDGHRTVS